MTFSELPRADARPPSPAVLCAAILLFSIVLIRTGWICDDAFITLRSLDNWANGFGLRWNVAERVQVFTHPLWAGVLMFPYLLTREPYFTTLTVGVVTALLGVVVLWRLSASALAFVTAVAVLLASKAFVDFSTSGLENPLSHVLLGGVVFGAAGSKSPERRFVLYLSAGLAMTTRHDLALLVMVPTLVVLWRARSRSELNRLALGLTPFVAWEVTSLVYFGSLLPNTAYAKLTTGIAQTDLWKQGVSFYRDSLARDIVTLPALLASALALAIRGKTGDRPASIAMLLYLTYVCSIGGDNMSGRFLTAPLFMGLASVSAHGARPGRTALGAAWVVLTGLLWFGPRPLPFMTGSDYGVGEPESVKVSTVTGIDDERRWYYKDTGLLRVWRAGEPTHEWVKLGRELFGQRIIHVSGFIGLLGYYAGPSVHIVDCHGLSEPLLARLPASRYWRTGHYVRRIPKGYLATLESGENQLEDPVISALYAQVKAATRDSLQDAGRRGVILASALRLPTLASNEYVTDPSGCDDIAAFYRAVLWSRPR